MSGDTKQPDISLETTYPGIRTAYDFVMPSYQWMISRLDAADTRIQTLQVFSASLMAVVPAIRTSGAMSFNSTMFHIALIAFALLIVIGTIARAWGFLALLSPGVLYDRWLHYQEWEFKKNAIYFAGQHFSDNALLINRKGKIVMGMTWLFIVQAIALLCWIS